MAKPNGFEPTYTQEQTLHLLWKAYIKASSNLEQSHFQPMNSLRIKSLLECSLLKTVIHMFDTNEEPESNFHINSTAHSFLAGLVGSEINNIVGDCKYIVRLGEFNHSKLRLDGWFENKKLDADGDTFELEIARQILCFSFFGEKSTRLLNLSSIPSIKAIMKDALLVSEYSFEIREANRFDCLKGYLMNYAVESV